MSSTPENTSQTDPAHPLKEQFSRISDDIDAMLQHDPFPANIEPPYLKEAVTAYPNKGGKRLRPAIVFWSCGLLGGNLQQARHAALAVELYHNWTLIHDDIIDNDTLRRGSPTCHVLVSKKAQTLFSHLSHEQANLFGRQMAVLAGDILYGWATAALNRLPHDGIPFWKTNALVEHMNNRVTPRLISGEAMDVELGQRDSVNREQVEYAMQLKTGVLLAYAAESGALISDNVTDLHAPELKTLTEFGHTLGLAFQLQDDYLGLYGSDHKLGKDIGSDLREGRMTYPVACALEKADTADRDALWGILRRKEPSEDDIDQAYELIENNGGHHLTLTRTEELFETAERQLDHFTPGKYQTLFKQLVAHLRERQT